MKDLPKCGGYDTFNEPISWYIGWPDLNGGMACCKRFKPYAVPIHVLGRG
jgi:hypothetical protein